MKGVVQILGLLLLTIQVGAQAVSKQLAAAISLLEDDQQFNHATIALYVVDSKTGAVVYNKNGAVGLAAGSTQKVITSTASFELLGQDYQYKTTLGYSGSIVNQVLNGNLYIIGNGDPSLGSWRYANTHEDVVINKWLDAINSAGIKNINGDVIVYTGNFETQTIPGGWIWDDLGNYYGAGVTSVNWRENQYDIILRSGNNDGAAVKIVSTKPLLYDINFTNELTTGKQGSGDNAYIYLPPYATQGYLRGTIPPNKSAFEISGSFSDPANQLKKTILDALSKNGIKVNTLAKITANDPLPVLKSLHTHQSPTLDSLVYWFLKKSINLYGEAFLKTLAYNKNKFGSTEGGLDILKSFWKQHDIDIESLHMSDGSGLSPENRITAQALVQVMQYARSQDWYKAFYTALPEFNSIKMKSGTIGGAKSFTGYCNGYTFAIIINNFNGSSSQATNKMYRILDLLK